MDGATPQPDELHLALPGMQPDAQETAPPDVTDSIPPRLLDDLCLLAQTASVGLSRGDFEAALLAIGAKHNFGLPAGAEPSPARREIFLRALQLADLALAQACALGRETAWLQFLARFRQPLTQAAIAITRSSSLGPELADSLYADLFGLSARDGRRRSPLASFSGRGSLLGWLRTSLAQRHVDHHRRTRRESPLEDGAGFAVRESAPTPLPEQLTALSRSVTTTLAALPAEDRFLLSAYFLDQRTLQQIAPLLGVHEATVSRKLKRLTAHLRERLLAHLRAGGLSKRAAEEALGVDPRDLDLHLRNLLQTSAAPAFSTYSEKAIPSKDIEEAKTAG